MIPNLSKEMIDLMQQLRKRLRSEFDVDVKLSQPDVIQQLLQLVDKSHDQKTLLLFADLEDMMGITLEHSVEDSQADDSSTEEHDKIVRRIYRGQVIEERVAKQPMPQATSTTKRIYRGREVA